MEMDPYSVPNLFPITESAKSKPIISKFTFLIIQFLKSLDLRKCNKTILYSIFVNLPCPVCILFRGNCFVMSKPFRLVK